MSARVVLERQASPAPRRREGLQLGGHYRLPSGRVVVLDVIHRGVAQCHYRSTDAHSAIAKIDEVAFDPDWLQRFGQLNWGG